VKGTETLTGGGEAEDLRLARVRDPADISRLGVVSHLLTPKFGT
jgi:hypothetical protein